MGQAPNRTRKPGRHRHHPTFAAPPERLPARYAGALRWTKSDASGFVHQFGDLIDTAQALGAAEER